MALNYGSAFSAASRWAPIGKFLWRRFARVYPLYGCILFIAIAAHWLRHGESLLPWPGLLFNILLIQTWGFAGSIILPAWSISTETAAYVLFPWLAMLVLHQRAAHFAVALLMSIALLMLAIGLAQGDGLYHEGVLDLSEGAPALLRCLSGFLLGMSLFRIAESPRVKFVFTDTFGICLIVIYFGLLMASAPDLAVWPVLALFVLCLSGNRGRVGSAFGCQPVYILGLLSYGIYLIHTYFIQPMNRVESVLIMHVPVWCAWCLAVVAAAIAILCTSACAYLFVEEPARKILRGLEGNAKPGLQTRKA